MQPKKPRFNPLILALALAAVLMVWSVLGGGSSRGAACNRFVKRKTRVKKMYMYINEAW